MNESSKQDTDSKLQGEGDYEASRRYRDSLSNFVKHTDVDALASKARPLSAKEARELALAEESARTRSKGDDPTDLGIMYTRANAKVDSTDGT
jgi:hypothetical protein